MKCISADAGIRDAAAGGNSRLQKMRIPANGKMPRIGRVPSRVQ